MTDEAQPLAPLPRLLLVGTAFLVHLALGPGWLLRDGTPLGPLALAGWALAASRPGPGKRWIDALTFGAMYVGQTNWMGIVFWFAVPWVFVGSSLYGALAGEACLRLGRRLPLALAAPLAWIGAESLLAVVPPPLGLPWLRVGHAFSGWIELAGSGRVWGVVGLGWTLVALAGLLADLVRGRGRAPRAAWIGGLLPVGLAVLLPLLVPAPETGPGPRILLVQPAFEQARKQVTGTPEELFAESVALTEGALARLEEQGAPAPELVCWGETMLPFPLAEEGLGGTIERLEVDPWHPLGGLAPSERPAILQRLGELEGWVERALFRPRRGQPRLLPPGTSFLSGVETYAGHEGRLRRSNSVVLWRDGERAGVGGKQHLAPGGETMVGLERFELVRDIIYEVGGYVPDFLPAERTEVLELAGEGESWRMATGICFDNAFTDVFAGPLRREPVDLHLVVTNEAWYRDSQELDQMIAFSRLYALCTGRAVVRCANSGISAALGPDGRELARLEVDGRDREVRGTLVVDVPVPDDPAARTPFVRIEPWLLPLAALAPLALLLALRARRGTEER